VTDPQQREKLLLVDDDLTFCQVLALALRRRGYEVFVAHRLEEALSELRAWDPQFAVVDLRLAQQSGLDVLRQALQEKPQLRTVILTGYGSISSAVMAIKLGAVEYLTKPLSVDQLILALRGEASPAPSTPVPSLDNVEWDHIQRVLTQCDGNVSEAARRLNMHRRTLQRKLAKKPA